MITSTSQSGSVVEEPSIDHNRWQSLLLAASAAFCTYFCMYAFRKPFTAGKFEDLVVWGTALKTTLVIAQLVGYMISKFIGIRFVSQWPAKYRAVGILGLIAIAELALIGFALVPLPVKLLMMFINGLPLGMVFGLVLSYLEGRRQTEALAAALCASFIVSSGVVKSIGAWLIQSLGVSEYAMPSVVGLLFLPLLLLSIWMLERTPPPDRQDELQRRRRAAMSTEQLVDFVRTYWLGLSMLIYVYVALTIVRTLRDDFAVEIWRDLGVRQTPSVFAVSETIVAIAVVSLNALLIWIRSNWTALRMVVGLMCLSFLLSTIPAVFGDGHWLTPLGFMIVCGIGLYVPYVAFHTCVFERIVAIADKPANLSFVMYLADALGYLGYAVLIVWKTSIDSMPAMLPFFQWTLLGVAISSIVALLGAITYFQRVLKSLPAVAHHPTAHPPAQG